MQQSINEARTSTLRELGVLLAIVGLGLPGGSAAAQASVLSVTLSAEIPSVGRLGGVSMDSEGNTYVANFGASVWRVSPVGDVEHLSSELRGSSGNTVLADGRILQASFLDNRILEIHPGGDATEFASEGLDGPVGLTSDESGRVYVTNCRGNYIAVVEPNGTTRVLARAPQFDCPNSIALGPDGWLRVVSFRNGTVVNVSAETGETNVLTELPAGQNAHIAFASGSFYVTRVATGDVFRVGLDGGTELVVPGAHWGSAEGSPLLHPNGIATDPSGRFLVMNDLVGPWRGEEETRIVLWRLDVLPSEHPEALERIQIQVDDMVFDARASGPEDGPLVLLLHGFPQTSYAFRHQLRTLGELGYRAIAPDQRGYSPGARPDGVEAYGMAALSTDVVRIAEALGAEQFHLVGHDWGGAVGWVVATRFPNRVKTLTVLSTPHYGALSSARQDPGSDQADRSSYFGEFSTPGAEVGLLADGAARLRGIFGDLDSSAREEYMTALGNPEALRAALAWYGAAFGPAASRGPASNGGRATPSPVRVPTTYVWSTDDTAFGLAAAERTRDFVAGPYRFEILEGVDHWVTERVPDEVTKFILERIQEADPGTLSSYQKGRSVMEVARQRMGGDAVDRFTALTAGFEGDVVRRGQSPKAGPPFITGPIKGSLSYERDGRVSTAAQSMACRAPWNGWYPIHDRATSRSASNSKITAPSMG